MKKKKIKLKKKNLIKINLSKDFQNPIFQDKNSKNEEEKRKKIIKKKKKKNKLFLQMKIQINKCI